MSAILDTITGGGLLPHVYCMSAVLESSANPLNTEGMTVTLNFELYQKASNLGESNWLNNFNVLGANIYDSLKIEIVQMTHITNIKKLLASNFPVPDQSEPSMSSIGNIYVSKHYLGDGFLPRSALAGTNAPGSMDCEFHQCGNPFSNTIFEHTQNFKQPTWPYDKTYGETEYMTPSLRVTNISEIQNLSGKFVETESMGTSSYSEFNRAVDTGTNKAREELKNGELYYVVPFSQTFEVGPGIKNLGYLFYCYLDVPDFFVAAGLENVGNIVGENIENYIIEGSVNTEIVLIDGKPAQTREAFFLPDGGEWEGSVHLHSVHNPDPSGYMGDGGFGENRGWMVGEKHLPGVDQPKLALQEIPNNKIQDFRRSSKKEQYDGFLGLGVDNPVFALDQNVQGSINMFLSPFQKENRKYLSKFGAGAGGKEAHYNSVGVSYYDSDSEFSKLYLTRDSANQARGLFFIDKREFLFNNSKIFPILFDQDPTINLEKAGIDVVEAFDIAWNERPELREEYIEEGAVYTPGASGFAAGPDFDPDNPGDTPFILSEGTGLVYEERQKIINRSKILEIKLWRDRVKKQDVNNKREKWANDTSYEEPSYLVSNWTPKDQDDDPISDFVRNGLKRINLHLASRSSNEQVYFHFCDTDVGVQSAGLYQYRIEVVFEDASYSYLSDLLRDIVQVKGMLSEYYQFASGHYYGDDISITKVQKVGDFQPEELKRNLIPYYNHKTKSFSSHLGWVIQHLPAPPGSALERIRSLTRQTEYTASPLITILKKVKYIFGLSSLADVGAVTALINPSTGSLPGINHVISFVETVIKKLEELLNVTKLSKTGSELESKTLPNGYNYNNIYSFTVSPTDNIIYDDHTFYDLFEGVSNNDIYVEYLATDSDGLVTPTRYTGLKTISVADFTNRCQLEAAKYFHGHLGIVPGAAQTFVTTDETPVSAWSKPFFPIDPQVFGGLVESTSPVKSLDTLGYSFLAPSIIEISDPQFTNTGAVPDARFAYKAFLSNASQYVGTLHSPVDDAVGFSQAAAGYSNIVTGKFRNPQESQRLWGLIINHALNKEINPYADLVDNMTVGPHNFPTAWDRDYVEGEVHDRTILLREMYKKIFQNFGLQAHHIVFGAKFYGAEFDKKPGAQWPDLPDDEEYHISPGDAQNREQWLQQGYSDSNLDTSPLFQSILSSFGAHSLVKGGEKTYLRPDNGSMTSAQIHDWHSLDPQELELPNLFLFLLIDSYGAGVKYTRPAFKDLLGADMIAPYQPNGVTGQITIETSDFSTRGFRFANIDLMSRIEVYDPPPGPEDIDGMVGMATRNNIAKDDESSWRLLTKEDVEFVRDESYIEVTETKTIDVPLFGDLEVEETTLEAQTGLATGAMKLLCRFKLLQESRASGLHIPMLDKYFVLTK